jgi:hypothetical protein
MKVRWLLNFDCLGAGCRKKAGTYVTGYRRHRRRTTGRPDQKQQSKPVR